MPDSSCSISPPPPPPPPLAPLLFGEREWRLEHARRQQRLQQRHSVSQTGNAMPRLQYRLPVFRIPDGLLVCVFGLLIKAVLTCSQTSSNVMPPVILNGPPPQMIYDPTDKVRLPCAAYGTPPLMYEWFKNSEKLEPNADTVIQPDGSLTLNNQNDPVEGYYQCRVRNSAGLAISNITYLQAPVLDVTVGRNTIESFTGQACQSLALHCSHVLRSIPPATMTWFFDGDNPVILNDRVIVAENGSLVFTYLLQSDSNHNSSTFYRCRAYNPVTKREVGGSYSHLTVSGMKVERSEDEPQLLYASSPVVHALEGHPFQLSCLFGGVPTPLVEWLLPNGSEVKNVQHLLRIQSAGLSEEGNYTCRGKSLRHTKEEHFQVIVDALPRVATELKEQVAQRGSTVHFRCPAVGRPSPTVSWFINGTLHNESLGDDDLIMFDVQSSASISCNVSNKYGYHIRSTFLLVVDDLVMTTSSQGRIDDTAAPSTKATTNWAESSSDGWNVERHSSAKGDGLSRSSSSTPSNNSETERHAVSDDTAGGRENLWFLVALPVVVAIVVGLIAFAYCRRKRKQSYSLNDHESQLGLQARNRDLETNGDSDDSGYDDVSRKPRQLMQAKRLSDMPEVEESYL